jgi:N-acetylneuraminic acid mutarotase
MSMVAITDKLYMFGGSGPQSTCFQDLQLYDTVKNVWGIAEISDEEGRVRARAGHSMTAVGDKVAQNLYYPQIYIFGGSCG